MDFSKLIMKDGYYLYPTNNYTENEIKLRFDIDYSIKNSYIIRMIDYILADDNYKYPTAKDVLDRTKELYQPKLDFRSYIEADKYSLDLELKFLNKETIGEDLYTETIDFFYDLIFGIRFQNEREFTNNKKAIKVAIRRSLSNSENHVPRKLKSTVFKDLPLGISGIDDVDTLEQIIDSITLEDLKEFFNKYINSNYFNKGIAFGNINEEELDYIISKFGLKSNKQTLSQIINVDYNEDVVYEDENTSSSVYYLIFDQNNIPRSAVILIRRLLTGGSGLCHQILREKYGLVYNSTAKLYGEYNLGYLKATIADENKEKCIQAMDEIKELLTNKEYLQSVLPTIKKNIVNDRLLIDENRESQIDDIELYLRYNVKFDDVVKEALAYDANQLIEYTSKIKYVGSVYYRGVKR